MFVWKEIHVSDLRKNINGLDMDRMFKSGAIMPGSIYHVLEIEKKERSVRVLARLERGFEEYIEFRRKDYKRMPLINMEMA